MADTDEDNSDEISRLCEALRCVAKTTIVFCSLPDLGGISLDELALYYPVGAGAKEIKEIFRIGGATPDNNPWERAGGKNIIDYILPGCDVRQKAGCEVVQNNPSLSSGSSIATALAAGLAALLIHIVRMAAIKTYAQGKENSQEAHLVTLVSLDPFKSPDMMRATLDKMANKENGRMYVHVWSMFSHRSGEFESAENDPDAGATRWRVMAEMAREIVPAKYESERRRL